MYIAFSLPTGAGGMAAGHAAAVLKRAIHEWAEQYDIPYTTKIHKYTLRLCLEKEEHYTHFELSWNPPGYFKRHYQLIKPES
jgi:hypothetical protein